MTKGGIRTISRRPRYALVANHTARRTFITQMRRWGLTYDQVMAMTGHKDLRSIRIYDKMLKREVTKKVMDDLKSRFDAWDQDDKTSETRKILEIYFTNMKTPENQGFIM